MKKTIFITTLLLTTFLIYGCQNQQNNSENKPDFELNMQNGGDEYPDINKDKSLNGNDNIIIPGTGNIQGKGNRHGMMGSGFNNLPQEAKDLKDKSLNGNDNIVIPGTGNIQGRGNRHGMMGSGFNNLPQEAKDLMEQIRSARQSGDQSKVNELEKTLIEKYPNIKEPQNPNNQTGTYNTQDINQ